MRPHQKKLISEDRSNIYNDNYQRRYKKPPINDRRPNRPYNQIKYDDAHKMKKLDWIIKNGDIENNNGDIDKGQYKKDFKENQAKQVIHINEKLSDSTFFIKSKRRQNHYPVQRLDKQRLDNQLEQYYRKRETKDEPKKQRQYQRPKQKRQQYVQPKQAIRVNNKDESLSWNNQSFKKQKNKSRQNGQYSELNIAFENSLVSRQKPQKDDSGLWIEPQNLLTQLSFEEEKRLWNVSQLPIIHNQSLSYVSSIEASRSIRLKQEDKSLENQCQLFQQKVQTKQKQQNSESNKVDIEVIYNKIQECQNYEQKDVILKFINKQNILQFKIKEIELTYLGLNLNLTIENDNIIVKDSIIQIEQLIKYISFYKIHHIFPNIGFKQEQSVQFKFCRIKIPPVVQNTGKQDGTFIKKYKKEQKLNKCDINIKKIKLRCMNCMKFSTVPVIQEDNSAQLSCRQCNEKMEGRFSKISISK